jgi:hypothetical protein
MRQSNAIATCAFVVAAVIGGCRQASDPAHDLAVPAPPRNGAVLPMRAQLFAPALSRLSGEGSVDGKHLSDVETCGGCHADVFAQQQVSAHALSSMNNPIYRFGVEEFRSAVSKDASQMCAGCHDIALLVDGAMRTEVSPRDDRAHAGVTCRVCHGIQSATNDGNGSYNLSRQSLPLPVAGSPETIEAHKLAAAPPESEQLCGSCHRSFLSPDTGNAHFLAGMDELTSWKSSAYNKSGVGRIDDPVPAKTCVDCHMPLESAPNGDAAADKSGRVRSHRFLGGHTWLAAMLGNPTQLALQREMLRGSVTLDIAAVHDGAGNWTRPADGAPLPTDGKLWIDVVARDVAVGHSYPAGVRDAVDSWVEIEVVDALGVKVASSTDDEHAHRFRALVGDRQARPQLVRNTHAFHQLIVDHTIPPRDARVVRYAVELGVELSPERLPLRIEARLLHRSRNLELQNAVCKASRSTRSRAFDEERRRREQHTLDPCAKQPVTSIATTVTWIGSGSATELAKAPRPAGWQRLYEHGLGLLAELPKEADAARASLLAAVDGAESSGDPVGAAKIYAALAKVYASAPCGPSAPKTWPSCEGRMSEGLRWLDAADALVPDHPAIARTRAELYQRNWRWPEAATWLSITAGKVPQNASVSRDLAVLLNMLGKDARALGVAKHGLSLLPRDPDLLRVQALALQGLGRPQSVVTIAKQAYVTHRRAERPTAVRARCVESQASCSAERLAVHTHVIPSSL